MRLRGCCKKTGFFFAILFTVLSAVNAGAASDLGSLLAGTEEAQIRPVSDESGKYLLKSDGFYCIGPDGKSDASPAVHYFDHAEIDGTVLDGYYYHDASGCYRAESPHIVYLGRTPCRDLVFEGYFMVGNLGRMTAAPQVRYIEDFTYNGVKFDGYYYFNENGRMVREKGIHYLSMDCHGTHFDGYYYFGGPGGELLLTAGETEEGFPVEAGGRLMDTEDMDMDFLHERLEKMLSGYEGIWSVYVKNLDTDETISINNQPLHAASLIKTFVMAKTYKDMDEVLKHEEKKMGSTDEAAAEKNVEELLRNMITVSDNESYNELVRLQSESLDFLDGAKLTDEFLEEEGYADTSVQHTLHPSASAQTGLGSSNVTSVEDCGRLLEEIYKGECVSEEASEQMLDQLLNQEVIWKIPAGVSQEVKIANKTGETDLNQHDIAIVYGPKTPYILCVMSEGCPNEDTAIFHIRDISETVYLCLNISEYKEE